MQEKNHKFWESQLKNLRCRAEQLLNSLTPADQDIDLGTESLKEEFRTLNVELEMQCEELQEAQQRLEKSQQYLADIFENTPVGYVILNDEGIIKSSNQAASNLLGLSKDILQNQRLSAFIPPTDYYSFRSSLQKAKKDKSTQSAEVLFRTRHGSSIHTRVTFFHLRSSFDEENVLLCCLQDNSPEIIKRQLERELDLETEEIVRQRTAELFAENEKLKREISFKNTFQQEAELSRREKAKFIAQVSHDIRTPLNSICLAFQILLDKALSDDQKQIVNLGMESSDILMELIDQILDYSALEENATKLSKELFSPLDHFKSAVDSLRTNIEHKGLELTVHIDENLPFIVEGDPRRFKQIIMNLLGNACKYTETGSITIGLGVHERNTPEQKTCFELRLKDTGIGIPPKDLQHIFEPFRQVSEERRQHIAGNGLGLSIVKELTRLMEGDITIDSALDQGTDIRCRFWLATTDRTLPDGDDRHSPQPLQKDLSILLIEDDRVTVDLMKRLFSEVNWKIKTAFSGRHALDLLKREHFDLVFVDIILPDLPGDYVTQQIKKMQDSSLNRETPFIALTANALPLHSDQGETTAYSSYINKPIEVEKFWRVLSDIVKKLPSG